MGASFLCRKLFFGPAERSERGAQAREGKADNVVIAAFNAGNVAAGASLNGVRAGFIEWFAAREVADDFVFIQSAEVDLCRFQKFAPLGIGQANERDAGDDRV